MKTTTFLPAVLLSAGINLHTGAFAQEPIIPAVNQSSYNTAIGLRAGQTSGLTLKHFFSESTAFEGIVGFLPYAVGFTALYEKHAPAFDTEGMKWYYGAGAHLAIGTGRTYYYTYYGDQRYIRYTSGTLGIGVDGILGLEYKINAIPFAISLDLKPFLEVANDGALYVAADPGLGIKFTF